CAPRPRPAFPTRRSSGLGSGVARLYSIAVAPGFGGKGVGRALLDAAEKAAFDHDRMMLRLEVRQDNARAIAIYEKAGYHRIGQEDRKSTRLNSSHVKISY